MLDPTTDTFVGEPIRFGAFPTYITASPQMQRVYVSNQFGAVSVLDTERRTVVSEIHFLAEAAHQLRPPLAGLQTQID